MRRVLLGICALTLVVAACGGDELSLTEYVNEVNALIDGGMERYAVLLATPQGAVLVAEGEELLEYEPQDLQMALDQLAEIQTDTLVAANAIDPPDQVADFHELFFRSLPIEELAARAGTATDWYELSNSAEMEAYRSQLVNDARVCDDFQAKLDATEARGAFADVPWIPSDLKEIAETSLGCSVLPERPGDMYRPPPNPDS